MINSNKRHGFTLIALAVVLAIIAVVMAGVMDLTKINIERQKREETIERAIQCDVHLPQTLVRIVELRAATAFLRHTLDRTHAVQ